MISPPMNFVSLKKKKGKRKSFGFHPPQYYKVAFIEIKLHCILVVLLVKSYKEVWLVREREWKFKCMLN